MSARTVSLILCEGIHDRAFWAGLLQERHAWTVPTVRDAGGRSRVPDPYDAERFIAGDGVFRLDAPASPATVLIIPCGGDRKKVFRIAREKLEQRETRPIAHVILNVDADTTSAEETQARVAAVATETARLASLVTGAVASTEGDGAVLVGDTHLRPLVWQAPDGPMPGVPEKHTLERMVCAALSSVYPERARLVDEWLGASGAGAAGAKAWAWFYMAGWYTKHGCDDFFRAVWRDDEVAARLREILLAAAAGPTLAALGVPDR